MLRLNSILNWTIIILGFILAVLLFVLPKDHCDVCNFDGKTGKEWFSGYSMDCLEKYNYGSYNPNLPTLNLSNLQPYYSYP